jgi:hypothetical protein
MKNWRILGIGNEPSIFWRVKKEMVSLSPGCLIDLATTFEDGQELLLMYTYDAVIVDFESPVASDLAGLIKRRGFSIVAISQNGLPAHPKGMSIKRIVSPTHPEEISHAALQLLQRRGFLVLRRVARRSGMWISRVLSQLIPKKASEADFTATLLFY